MTLAKNGGIGICSLGVIFRRKDSNENRKLDFEEFEKCMAAFGVFPTIVQLQTLFKFYDVNGNGNISYEEFIKSLREPLNERRKNIVLKNYDFLIRQGNGVITVKDIFIIYGISRNSDFISGKFSRGEILNSFLSGFEGLKGNHDGTVTKQEWTDYYSDVTMSIESDAYFVGMIELVWKICENCESQSRKDVIKILTVTIRQKLLSFANKQSEEQVLRTIFSEFDTNRSGILTVDELNTIFVKLQISVERYYLHFLLQQFDRNQNGVIEFDEFVNYIIHNPYK